MKLSGQLTKHANDAEWQFDKTPKGGRNSPQAAKKQKHKPKNPETSDTHTPAAFYHTGKENLWPGSKLNFSVGIDVRTSLERL